MVLSEQLTTLNTLVDWREISSIEKDIHFPGKVTFELSPNVTFGTLFLEMNLNSIEKEEKAPINQLIWEIINQLPNSYASRMLIGCFVSTTQDKPNQLDISRLICLLEYFLSESTDVHPVIALIADQLINQEITSIWTSHLFPPEEKLTCLTSYFPEEIVEQLRETHQISSIFAVEYILPIYLTEAATKLATSITFEIFPIEGKSVCFGWNTCFPFPFLRPSLPTIKIPAIELTNFLSSLPGKSIFGLSDNFSADSVYYYAIYCFSCAASDSLAELLYPKGVPSDHHLLMAEIGRIWTSWGEQLVAKKLPGSSRNNYTITPDMPSLITLLTNTITHLTDLPLDQFTAFWGVTASPSLTICRTKLINNYSEWVSFLSTKENLSSIDDFLSKVPATLKTILDRSFPELIWVLIVDANCHLVRTQAITQVDDLKKLSKVEIASVIKRPYNPTILHPSLSAFVKVFLQNEQVTVPPDISKSNSSLLLQAVDILLSARYYGKVIHQLLNELTDPFLPWIKRALPFFPDKNTARIAPILQQSNLLDFLSGKLVKNLPNVIDPLLSHLLTNPIFSVGDAESYYYQQLMLAHLIFSSASQAEKEIIHSASLIPVSKQAYYHALVNLPDDSKIIPYLLKISPSLIRYLPEYWQTIENNFAVPPSSHPIFFEINQQTKLTDYLTTLVQQPKQFETEISGAYQAILGILTNREQPIRLSQLIDKLVLLKDNKPYYAISGLVLERLTADISPNEISFSPNQSTIKFPLPILTKGEVLLPSSSWSISIAFFLDYPSPRYNYSIPFGTARITGNPMLVLDHRFTNPSIIRCRTITVSDSNYSATYPISDRTNRIKLLLTRKKSTYYSGKWAEQFTKQVWYPELAVATGKAVTQAKKKTNLHILLIQLHTYFLRRINYPKGHDSWFNLVATFLASNFDDNTASIIYQSRLAKIINTIDQVDQLSKVTSIFSEYQPSCSALSTFILRPDDIPISLWKEAIHAVLSNLSIVFPTWNEEVMVQNVNLRYAISELSTTPVWSISRNFTNQFQVSFSHLPDPSVLHLQFSQQNTDLIEISMIEYLK